ncbi:complement C3-like isoform X2 [Xyrauchen texanus]|uniref:complement C3-like isoform X2 n=1 Tax=Xyrauchen texanus TaxID=154827 RepID=UPI002242899B|nr:complement C3-like isoform X2 [Xyrauchen texanus]
MCIYKLTSHPIFWRKWLKSHSILDICSYKQTNPSTHLKAQHNRVEKEKSWRETGTSLGQSVLYRIFSLTPNQQPHSLPYILVEITDPEGNIVEMKKIHPAQGMISLKYPIPEIASPGIWKVVTRYINTPQRIFTADFEVKEYVLPTFEVTLMLSKTYFHVHDDVLEVDISAEYLSGTKVSGHAIVVFGVKKETIMTSINSSLQRVEIKKGKGNAELTSDMILQTFPNIEQLVGHSIYVSVSVLTESGSEIVKALRQSIPIVTSPYTIDFKRMAQFFKPGLPLDVSVYLTNPDQTPAENVEVEVNPGGVNGRTKANGIVKVTINSQEGSSTLEITVKTNDPQLSSEQQSVKRMTAQAYKPKDGSNNYLHIHIDAAEPKIGDIINVILYTSKNQGAQDFTYLILSKGQIVQVNRSNTGQSPAELSLTVTKDMVPSFRFVAYYHVGSSEVVSDSVWVDVKDTCMGTLKVEVKDKAKYYHPGDEFSLQITGDPGAKVGLVVVDKAVQVLNKNRLTQTKIWDIIEKRDIGCTAGSGKDSMGVFYDAGLMFESNSAGGTNIRTVDECRTLSKNRRRSVDEIDSRKQFPEHWFRDHVHLPTCKDNNCATTSFIRNKIFLKESITTWQILAISLSQINGICVAEIEEMITHKNFFIDLKMPYSAVHKEQVEIRAILHNKSSKRLKVFVEFIEAEHVSSKNRTEVEVRAYSTGSVKYVITPMTVGKHVIEVKAATYDFVYTDGVKKTLNVVMGGVLGPLKKINLNPAKKGGEQLEVIRADIPADHIPDTPAFTHITVTGDGITQILQQVITDIKQSKDRFVLLGHGIGENNVISMSLYIIYAHYLYSTNQWDSFGMHHRDQIIKKISTDYQRELKIRKADGSYAAPSGGSDTIWLTAYVAKVFAMARNLIHIEENVICSALKWLVPKQQPGGAFKVDRDGDVRGNDADASLTAFVLIAMQEGVEICAQSVGSLHDSMRKAVDYLESRLPEMTNPNAVAMTSYAMANADKLNKDLLMKHSNKQKEGTAWIVNGEEYQSLAATAYAVLALVKAKEYDRAREAVHWLDSKLTYYGSSEIPKVATTIAFQAETEYKTQIKDPQNYRLEVEMSVEGRPKKLWILTAYNAHVTWSDLVQKPQCFSSCVAS